MNIVHMDTQLNNILLYELKCLLRVCVCVCVCVKERRVGKIITSDTWVVMSFGRTAMVSSLSPCAFRRRNMKSQCSIC